MVDTVVVVAVAGEFTLDVEGFGEPLGVAAGRHAGVFDGRERVEGDRETGHAVGEIDAGIGVDECHLGLLVVVLVVHVVDDVHGLVVDAGDLLEHHLVVAHHLLEAQRTLRQRRNALDHQRAGVLAATFVNGQQQGLGQVGAGAEELDLAADVLERDAAGDAVVVRVAHFAHQVVVLVLDRAGVGRNLGAEVLESLRQLGAPENREVRFGRRTEVVERLQEAERGLRHLRATVVEASADGLGHPRRVAGEDVVVGLHAQVAHHAQLNDELVDQLLGERLVDRPVREVVFDEDVEERRYVAQRHGGSVLLLDGGQIGHVDPLHGLLRRMRRAAEVQSVVFAHRADVLQGLDLLGDLFAQADAGVGHRAGEVAEVLLLGLDQAVGSVEGQTAVVADDAAAGVVVGKTRQEAQRAERADLLGVDVEHAVVVRLAVVGEDVLHLLVDLHAVLLAGARYDIDAAERFDGALEQFVGLKAHDQLVFAVDVAGLVRGDGRNGLVVQRADTVMLTLLFEGLEAEVPDVLRSLGRSCEERGVAQVGGDVCLYEARHVDLFAPKPVDKGFVQFHR